MRIKPALELGIFSYLEVLPFFKLSKNIILLGEFEGETWFVCDLGVETRRLPSSTHKWIDLRNVATQLSASDKDDGRATILGGGASMLS